MNNLGDKCDKQEPEPELHFFDLETSPKMVEVRDDESEISSILLDTSLDLSL
jgi:hypothetical protein